MIVTFDIKPDGSNVIINPASEAFKDGGIVAELAVDEIAFDTLTAYDIAVAELKEKFSDQLVDKTMLIVQNLEDKLMYNITFISKQFNTINIKVDAKTKEVIDIQKRSILDLGKN